MNGMGARTNHIDTASIKESIIYTPLSKSAKLNSYPSSYPNSRNTSYTSSLEIKNQKYTDLGSLTVPIKLSKPENL